MCVIIIVGNNPTQGVRTMNEKQKKELREWIWAIAISLVVIHILRSFVFSTYVVNGLSMEPNFHDGDRMIVNKLIYHIREPKRGEVVILHANTKSDYVKRVIALPGDTIRVEGDNVYVNGEKIVEPYLEEAVRVAHEAGMPYNRIDQEEITVPDGYVFVMGDNRSYSRDSRSMGPIPISEIVGRSDVVFFPFNSIRIVQHK